MLNSSAPEYWENAYKTGDMAWDIGGPTPIFSQWINMQNNPLSICVLGAGNGWDALNFAEKGHNVTAVDFAESAIKNIRIGAEELGVKINLLHLDIFDLGNLYPTSYDIVLEYTCYCAIDPTRRNDYINIVNLILKQDGKFVAIFFPPKEYFPGDKIVWILFIIFFITSSIPIINLVFIA